jgi:intermembrane space import and assembly protein 40
MSVVEEKDTVRFVDEEQINQAAAAETKEEAKVEGEEPKEEEAASAAFNPETGEINWDCPCK